MVGDGYIVAAGHEDKSHNHSLRMLAFARAMLQAAVAVGARHGLEVQIAIGIHKGEVYGGVVGIRCPRYHFFGPTLSVSNAIERACKPGKILLSAPALAAIPTEKLEAAGLTFERNSDNPVVDCPGDTYVVCLTGQIHDVRAASGARGNDGGVMHVF